MHLILSVSLLRAWATLRSLVVPSAKAAVTAIAGSASGVLFISISAPLSFAAFTVTVFGLILILAPIDFR